MALPARQMIAALKFTRFSVAIGAIANIWLVLFITKSDSAYVGTSVYGLPWWSSMLATAVIAVGMCGFAAALNDTIDARHDATFHPTRPIPSGWVPIAQAVVLMVCSLLFALLAASFLGSWPVRIGLLTAAAILFYNIAGKHVPAVGLVSIGLIYASHMLIANIGLTFTLPVWLVMTHAMICSIAMYNLEGKRPKISFRGWVGITLGWVFWSVVLLSGPFAKYGTLLPEGFDVTSLLWPLAAVAFFTITIRWKVSNARTGQLAAEKIRRYGALWECVYAAAWLMALQFYGLALFMVCFALCSAILIMLVKEATGVTGQPISWRA
ncbi:MAG: UbiA family prenyltransferase [Phycisphaerales bacterium]|nr:UbiA family prenyltransferase [Planctomycetota bacterium]MBL6997464.1 UbiA family prenyltransferase [Phycisphaerales bacterium]